MASEKPLLNELQLKASQLGHRLFRNNTAKAWVGKLVANRNGNVVLENARVLHAGIGVGGPDLIGWTVVEVTPEMVGRKLAVFTGIEAKTGKVPVTLEQERFLQTVQGFGGIAQVVWSEEDYERHLRNEGYL